MGISKFTSEIVKSCFSSDWRAKQKQLKSAATKSVMYSDKARYEQIRSEYFRNSGDICFPLEEMILNRRFMWSCDRFLRVSFDFTLNFSIYWLLRYVWQGKKYWDYTSKQNISVFDRILRPTYWHVVYTVRDKHGARTVLTDQKKNYFRFCSKMF